MIYAITGLVILLTLIIIYLGLYFASGFIGHLKCFCSRRSNAPFIPIPTKNLVKALDHVSLGDNSVFYDLGSGNGKVLFELAKKYKRPRLIGIERDFFPFLISKLRNLKRKRSNVGFVHADFFNVDMTKATHIFVYLFPEIMNELLPKLESELRSGTIVYSVTFTFSGKKPDQIIDILTKSRLAKRLYIYKF